MKTPDTSPGITPQFHHVVAGMHIGPMTSTLPAGRFDAVLTVATQPGTVPDGVLHRHEYLSYFDMDTHALGQATGWVHDQVAHERRVLVRSEVGRQRPALVVGAVILGIGGYYLDAISCLRAADPRALTDFRYLNLLRAADETINGRLHPKIPTQRQHP